MKNTFKKPLCLYIALVLSAQLDALCIGKGYFYMAKKEIICGIYKITSPTLRVYIGQSVNILRRWSDYKGMYCQRQPKLYNSFKKYGVENHKFEIIQICEKQELDELEIYYETIYQSTSPKTGLNDKTCGPAGRHSYETLLRISNKQKGKKLTDEHKEKLRLKSIGNKSTLGQKQSPETIAKRVAKITGLKRTPKQIENLRKSIIGFKHTDETRKNMSKAKKGKRLPKNVIEKRSKIILNLETGIYYIGTKEASEQTPLSKAAFTRRMNGYFKNNTSFIYA